MAKQVSAAFRINEEPEALDFYLGTVYVEREAFPVKAKFEKVGSAEGYVIRIGNRVLNRLCEITYSIKTFKSGKPLKESEPFKSIMDVQAFLKKVVNRRKKTVLMS